MERIENTTENEVHTSTDGEKSAINPHQDIAGRPSLPMSKEHCMRNLIVASSCFFLFRLGFFTLSTLESTINATGGWGVKSQAVIFATSMLSSLFLSDLAVKSIGCKWTMVYGLVIGCSYLAANIHVKPAVLMTGSVLFGLVSGPRNTAKAAYVKELAVRYAKASESDCLEKVLSRFFGIFVTFTQATQMVGNIVSYLVLDMDSEPANSTGGPCGADFLEKGNESNSNSIASQEKTIDILIGIYLICGALSGLLMALFADSLHDDVVKVRCGEVCATLCGRLCATVKLLRKPKMILMIPLTVFFGIAAAFYMSDFTQAYIACSYDVRMITLVGICFGASGCLSAIMIGPLTKRFSQVSVILISGVVHFVLSLLLLFWDPVPKDVAFLFVTAFVWGMLDSIWSSQIAAVYGLLFPNDRDAAYSNLFFWYFLGSFLQFTYASYFAMRVKIIILLTSLITGLTGYVFARRLMLRSSFDQYDSFVSEET